MTGIQKYIKILSLIIFFPIYALGANTNEFGSPYDNTIPLKPISFIYDATDIDGQILSFQGVVTAQCKNDGCWLKIMDNTSEVLVDFKPYDFRPPLKIVGKKVKLNGRVNTKNDKAKVDAISVILLD